MLTSKAARLGWIIIFLGIVSAVLIPWIFPCIVVEGATYRSNKEVDNLVGGMMYLEVSFGDGTFTWVVTDMLIAGIYECRSGRITAYPYSNPDPITIQLEPGANSLILDGQKYERVSR